MLSKHFRCALGLYLLCASMAISANDMPNKKGAEVFTIGCELTQIPQQKSDIAIKARLDKDVYKIGDELQLEVKPSADAYITIIDQGSDALHPERGYELFSDVFVSANNAYTFPPPHSVPLVVSGQSGINTFEIIAARSPNETQRQANSKDVNHKVEDAVKRAEDTVTRCTVRFELKDK